MKRLSSRGIAPHPSLPPQGGKGPIGLEGDTAPGHQRTPSPLAGEGWDGGNASANRNGALTRRRAIFAALAAAAPLHRGQAQTPILLGILTVSDPGGLLRAVRGRLRELGFVEGREISFVVEHAGGEPRDIPARAASLLQRRPSMVIASGVVAIRAVRSANPDMPIVALAGDLVAMGFAQSFARPGGQITGISFIGEELNAKRLEILAELLPRPARVMILADSASGTSVPDLQVTAAALGLSLFVVEIGDLASIERILPGARARGADAVNVLASPVLNTHRRRIIALLDAERLPAIHQWPETVADGGLIAYGPSLMEMYRQLGSVTARILRGAKPAEVPIEQPVRFDLAVNLRAAAAIGVAIPAALLARADEVIE